MVLGFLLSCFSEIVQQYVLKLRHNAYHNMASAVDFTSIPHTKRGTQTHTKV